MTYIQKQRFTWTRKTTSLMGGNAGPLLGLLPLEEMDVIINPNRNELIVNPEHPDYALHKI